jgi:gentisate 1,2-dioxygenase
MSKNTFNSSDFGKTNSDISVKLPERLLHKNIEKIAIDSKFSKERKHAVHIVSLPTNCISMTIGHLLPSEQSNRHRHAYETVAYILEGKGYSIIENRKVVWQKGDAIYIPNWAWHHHVNSDSKNPAKYLASENAPMLQNLGLTGLREESS